MNQRVIVFLMRYCLIFLFLLVLNATAEEGKWIDLADHLRLAKKPGAPQLQRGSFTSGGREEKGIFLHAPNEIVFAPFPFPKTTGGIQSIQLRTAIGFKDGEGFVQAKSDGCRFVILANGEEVYQKDYATQKWLPASIDLTKFAGQEVRLTMRTEARKNSAADWACFAEPALWIGGSEAAVQAAVKTSSKMTSPWKISDLRKERTSPSRVFLKSDRAHIAVIDEHLDLASALKILNVKSPVPLAPVIVAGEGAHPDNHTLVKVLSEHGVTEAQFLAFPPSVRGGVRVEAFDGMIAATPLAKKQPAEIALIHRNGTSLGTIIPKLKPPFVLAAVGKQLAVSSKSGGDILIYSSDGRILKKYPGKPGLTSLSSHADNLLVYSEIGRLLTIIDLETGESSERTLKMLPPGRKVFGSAFGDNNLWAGGPQSQLSHVYEITADGKHIGRDIGREENQFWLALPKEWEKDFGPFKGKDKAKHIRFGSYGHIRIDSLSPRYRNPDAPDWAGVPFVQGLAQRGLTKPLDQQVPKMWNPTFTHRQFPGPFRAWAEQKDSRTGQNRWLQQSPTGGMDGYGNWDKPGFVSSTYAPGADAMQSLYTETLRSFVQAWSPLYRAQPWLAPSIEPNHEFEAVTATDAGIGDYNPHMIADFFDWLVRHYGDDPSAWQKRFGVAFDEFFDAPRDLARGKWDRYDAENPFVLAWIEFNRHVINRTLALTFRESLAAGIPPEMIRSHQIPDTYAIGPVLGGGIARITPIDYAMVAGVGFGFTKFGVNSEKEDNIVKAANSSGFDSLVMGEFQPLSTDSEVAEKELRYVFESGVKAIHPLYWGAQHTGGVANPEDHLKNKTVYDAIQNLLDEDPPRAGQAGGIGEVRAHRKGDRAYNVVSIGTGAQHRGLIKSIRADGRMEGSVYVIPFHQHIRVEELTVIKNEITVADPVAPGSQIEIQISAPAGVTISVLRGGVELPDLRGELKGDRVRYTLRMPERMDELSLHLKSTAEFKVLHATLQSPECADVHTGRHTGIPHRGGVMFDLLDD